MPVILLKTVINSNIDVCFDLSRSVDLHPISTFKSNELAVDGKTNGLLDLGDWVTWEARHLGVRQRLTSKITSFDRSRYFQDTMMNGAFKSFYHDHFFEVQAGSVLMTDKFVFESPLGIIGKAFNVLFLTRYMERLLIERNFVIKDYAETDKWESIINP